MDIKITLKISKPGNFILVVTMTGLVSTACFSTFTAAQENDALIHRQKLMHDGIERSYVVREPRQLQAYKDPIPLVLVLHGGGGNADSAARITGFSSKADKDGFIVVYPEGTSRIRGKLQTWNADHCCGYAMKKNVDDVGFISALIDRIVSDYPVDPLRIYATGMSNGGMMTHKIGIMLSRRIAAIAPVVATVFGDEVRPAHPVPALMLNGMLDKSVPVAGGPPGGRFRNAWDGKPTQPARQQAEFWAEVNGCAGGAEQDDRGPLVFLRYRCPAGRAVEIYLIKDNGHAWPGGKRGSPRGDKPSTALNGTEVIWKFFKMHKRSGGI